MNKRALIAMSGGVDSSVAAALMCENGYECIGITMKLYNNEDVGVSSEKACCTLSDTEDARSVAYRLGMRYYVLNFTDDFEGQVIRRFITAYEKGETPNPCIDCNRYMKFDKLYQKASMLGCDTIVTGHYARVVYDKNLNRWLLKKSLNPAKDQSYVLYFMTQEQLAHTQFPLGSFSDKEEVRSAARKYNFVNAGKHDSQDICFVPNGNYSDFIEQYTEKKYAEGNFVDTEGKILGTHKGMIRYTIGQRKGLALSLPSPMYVCRKCPEDNTVVLSDETNLYSNELTAGDFNWIAFEKPETPIHVTAKTRYHAKEAAAVATVQKDGTVKISFEQPQRAITKGQAVVLYDGDTVVGGGTIIA
ncbi:MAG: tRNA 2-thiouridine(34) synthase MnmA [Eubacteriales bacterium]|nr:tRNA 2-thiouridine(34) synthase MnmA [Eubacteriales bacterium]